MQTTEQENLAFRYLLGELPEAEQIRLEQEFFGTGEAFEQVWAAENALVDRYVRGRLSPRERERFELHYLATPKHRERVALASELLKAADGEFAGKTGAPAAGMTEVTSSWWDGLFGMLRGPQGVLGGAMAGAMLLLALGVGWLVIERSRLNDQLERVQAERGAIQHQELQRLREELERRVAEQRTRGERLSAEVEKLREQIQGLEARGAVKGSSGQPVLFSFLLDPSLKRSGGEAQQLIIPRGARQVELRMKVEGGDYQSYRFTLGEVGGQVVLSRQSLRPRSNRDESILSVTAPVEKLSAGDYIVTLSGVRSNGEAEEVNRYFFRVKD